MLLAWRVLKLLCVSLTRKITFFSTLVTPLILDIRARPGLIIGVSQSKGSLRFEIDCTFIQDIANAQCKKTE